MARKSAAPTPIAVRDAVVGHVEAALHALQARHLTNEQIHTARKQLKRARAGLRLLRDAVGKDTYAKENASLRDAARPLSGVRDAKVLLETADVLIGAARKGPRRSMLVKTRQALEKARREARAELRVMSAAKDSAEALSAAAERIHRWKVEARESA